MNVLILGGNSKKHYEWNRQLAAYSISQGDTPVIHDYYHWSAGEELSINWELKRLRDTVASLDTYIVVAKSVGTVIATLGVARGILSPSRCIFLGVPVTGVVREVAAFGLSLTSLPPTHIFQNEFDPYGTVLAMREYMSQYRTPKLTISSIPDIDTHEYLDFQSYLKKESPA